MIYQELRPDGALGQWVEYLWVVASDEPEPFRSVLVPEGGVTVMFNFGDPQGFSTPDGRPATDWARSWVNGERSRPIVLESRGRVHLVGIRFRPGGASVMLGRGIHELTDRVVELDLVLGRRADRLQEALAAKPAGLAQLQLLEAMLAAELSRAVLPDAVVLRAARELEALGPSASIRGLADRFGVSHRHLVSSFGDTVGLAPKATQRILRLRRVVQLEFEEPSAPWSRLATRAGYFDQSHLIRDFRAFTGVTPSVYRARRQPWPGYFEPPPGMEVNFVQSPATGPL